MKDGKITSDWVIRKKQDASFSNKIDMSHMLQLDDKGFITIKIAIIETFKTFLKHLFFSILLIMLFLVWSFFNKVFRSSEKLSDQM